MSADETVDVRALAERIIKEGVGRSQDVPLAIGYCWFGPYPSDDDYVTADMVTALATAYLAKCQENAQLMTLLTAGAETLKKRDAEILQGHEDWKALRAENERVEGMLRSVRAFKRADGSELLPDWMRAELDAVLTRND